MTVLTLTNLTLTEAVECDHCIDPATLQDQNGKCYCNDCLPTNCDNCGQHDDNITVLSDNTDVCTDCLADCIQCDNCQQYANSEDSVTTASGDKICEQCYDNEFFTCDCCDEIYHYDDRIEDAHGNDVCRGCIESRYTMCYECEEFFHEEDTHYSEAAGEYYCQEHLPSSYTEDFDDDSPYVLNYSYDVRKKLGLKGNPSDRIYFGVELELNVSCDEQSEYNYVADKTLDNLRGFALLKADSSIHDGEYNGFEIVTTATSFDLQKQHWDCFFQNIDRDLYASDNCGMHVHVSKKRLSTLDILKIICFLNAVQNYDFLTAIAGRKSTHYSQYKHNKKIKRRFLNTNKYEPLNVKATTIEFRLFAATIEQSELMARLELVHAIVYFCKNCSIKSLYYLDLVDFILSRKKDYKYLAKWIDNNKKLCLIG